MLRLLDTMDARFECFSETTASWFYKESNRSIGTGNVLEIPNVNSTFQGIYECEGRTEDGETFRAQGTLIVLSMIRSINAKK